MKNIAEFQIIGRIGKIAEVGKALKVDIAANYGKKDPSGVWRDDPYWNSITIFDEQTQNYIHQGSPKAISFSPAAAFAKPPTRKTARPFMPWI